jgi:hypothetical protein
MCIIVLNSAITDGVEREDPSLVLELCPEAEIIVAKANGTETKTPILPKGG